MVRGVVAGLQEDLKQEQVQTETPMVLQAPVDHVANAVQNIQKQLDTQLQKTQAMIQEMQMQYAAGPQNAHQDYGGRRYHGGHANYCGQGVCGAQRRVNWRGCCSGCVNRDLTHNY